MIIKGIERRLKLEEHPSLIYLYLFLATMLTSSFIFGLLGLFHTNIETARYLLSALVQSEAAIIAIVITLSLVAVQLTASSFSPRVIDIFKKSPDLWILMGSYIFSIVMGFIVLKKIDDIYGVCTEICLSSSLFLGFYCFVALVPYTYNVFEMLKPSTIIRELSKNITKENLLKIHLEEENENLEEIPENVSENDPILPIIDIIRGSIMKYDYETTRTSVGAIGDRLCEIFDEENFSQDEEKKISKTIRGNFIEIGEFAVKKENESIAMIIIERLEKISNITMIKSYKKVVSGILLSLIKIGRAAVEKELVFIASSAAENIGIIGKKAVERSPEFKNKAGASIQHLATMDSITRGKNKFKHTSYTIVTSLEGIRDAAREKGINNIELETNRYLDEIKITLKKSESNP